MTKMTIPKESKIKSKLSILILFTVVIAEIMTLGFVLYKKEFDENILKNYAYLPNNIWN